MSGVLGLLWSKYQELSLKVHNEAGSNVFVSKYPATRYSNLFSSSVNFSYTPETRS